MEEPTTIPNVVEWVHACFTTTPLPYLPTLTDLKYDREDNINIEIEKKCLALTPLTCKFKSFFSKIDGSIIQCKSSSIVEALSSVGFTSMILDTLPETVLIPFKEAITACQNEPEAKWGKKLLTFVGREDVNMLLFQDGKNITTIPVLVSTTIRPQALYANNNPGTNSRSQE